MATTHGLLPVPYLVSSPGGGRGRDGAGGGGAGGGQGGGQGGDKGGGLSNTLFFRH